MKSSESIQKLLSSPLPVVLISFFIAFTQFMFLFELDALSSISIIRIVCNTLVLGYILILTSRFKVIRYTLAGIIFLAGTIKILIIVYVRYFHVIPNLFSIKLISQTGAAAHSLSELLSPDLFSIFFGILLVTTLIIMMRPTEIPKKWGKILAPIIIILLLFPWIFAYTNKNSLRIGKNRAHFLSASDRVELYGYLYYVVYHFIEIQSNLDYNNHLENPIISRRIQDNFSRPKNRYNFILIQVESLDNTLIGKKTKNGVPIIPVITKLAYDNLYFPNIYAHHGPGGSSDAEFSVLTGLLPLADNPVFLSHELNHLPSVVKELKKYGYSGYGLHGNDGNFWNRTSAYQQLGFEKFYDSKNYSEWASGWKCLDGEFLKESIPYLEQISKKKPFFAYMITISMHCPYNITFVTDNNKNITDDDYHNICYFQRAHYTDRGLGLFIDELKKKGILDDTILILFGDHTTGLKNKSYDCNKNISENIPLIIVHPDKKSGIVPTFGSQIDIPPTVLDLAGIPRDNLMLGKSLLRSFPDRLYPIVLASKNYIITPFGLTDIKDQSNPIYEQIIDYSRSYFYKIDKRNEIKNNPFYRNRFIAHALGSVNNIKYTNSLEAFEESYKKGFQVMEVDLSLTQDNKLVCFHEGSEKDFNLKHPINKTSHKTFLSKKIHHKYTPLDFNNLLTLMEKNPDIYIVTDIKGKFDNCISHIVNQTKEKNPELLKRIIPQIYFPKELAIVKKYPEFENIIFTLYKTSRKELPDSKIIDFVRANPEIKAVTVSISGFSMYLSSNLYKSGIPLYLHTVNKSEIIQKYQSMGVYGFYSDADTDFMNPVIRAYSKRSNKLGSR